MGHQKKTFAGKSNESRAGVGLGVIPSGRHGCGGFKSLLCIFPQSGKMDFIACKSLALI